MFDQGIEALLAVDGFTHSLTRLTTAPYLIRQDEEYLSREAVNRLIGHKETLQELHLTIPGDPHTGPWIVPELLTSLSSFPVLRRLAISAEIIYMDCRTKTSLDGDHMAIARLLPRSVVSLQLMVGGKRVASLHRLMLGRDRVSDWMRERLECGLSHLAELANRGQFPNLRSVSCATNQLVDLYGLRDVYARAGVDFGYDAWPWPRPARKHYDSG